MSIAMIRPAAGFHLGGIDHCPHTCQHAAADQCRDIKGDVTCDFDQRILMHKHLLREGREIPELVQGALIFREPFCQSRRQLNTATLAQIRIPGDAFRARTAEHRQTHHHVVARLHIPHILADFSTMNVESCRGTNGTGNGR
jgi:hypothetical protein